MSSEFVIWENGAGRRSGCASTADTRAVLTNNADTVIMHNDDGLDPRLSPHAPVMQISTSSSSIDGIEVVGSPQQPAAASDSFASWTWSWTGRIIENRTFKHVVVALLVLNAAVMGIATYPFASNNPEVDRILHYVDLGFLALFSIELGIRLIHAQFNPCKDPWLMFDVVVIGMSWLFVTTLVLRSFRILRTLRLATRLGPLRKVILAMGVAVPKLLFVFALLCFALFVFSVMFTKMFMPRGQEEGFDFFARVDVSALTLLQVMTLDDWTDIAREVMGQHDHAWLPFVCFIVTSSLFLSLCIAVVLDAVITVRQENELDTLSGARNNDSSIDRIVEVEQKLDQLASLVETITQQVVESRLAPDHEDEGSRFHVTL